MGFMGFGMQRWIYTQRPRHFFSKERKPTGNNLQSYNNDRFSSNYQISGKSWEYKPTPFLIKSLKVLLFIILVSIITFFIWGMMAMKAIGFTSQKKMQYEKYRLKKQKNEAYSFLTNSGRCYYKKEVLCEQQ